MKNFILLALSTMVIAGVLSITTFASDGVALVKGENQAQLASVQQKDDSPSLPQGKQCTRENLDSFELPPPSRSSVFNDSSVISGLAARLDCSVSVKEQPLVNFFATGFGKHEPILPLQAFYALRASRLENQTAVVEIVVDKADEFLKRHSDALLFLLDEFGPTSVCVRNLDPKAIKRGRGTPPNTLRFLDVPYRLAKYTYLGDVDVMYTEAVVRDKRLQQMKDHNISYSNIVRESTKRLTGVMLVETERFYTPEFKRMQDKLSPQKKNDEMFLYEMVEKAGLGIPKTTGGFRPLHGLHLSFGRGPGQRMCQPDWRKERDRLLWCRVLDIGHEFLPYDSYGRDYLGTMLSRAKEQVAGNITQIERCVAKK